MTGSSTSESRSVPGGGPTATRSGERRNVVRVIADLLTVRGWLFVVGSALTFGIGYRAGLAELTWAGCFLAALPLAAALLVRLRRPRLSVVRSFTPAVVSAGTPAAVELNILNVSASTSSPARWTDTLPWAPGFAGPGSLPTLLPTSRGASIENSTARLRYILRPPVRGVYEIGPLAVEYSDPFGLATAKASLGGIQSLYVTPATTAFGEGGPMIVAGDGSARLIQRHATGNDDDLMTREYRSGDALRRVHWRASARHGELMVRQEEQRTYPEARMVFDTRLDGWGGIASDDGENLDFEWAVRMVASLGVHLHRAGFLVQVTETETAQVAPLGDASQGSGLDVEFLQSLASIQLTPATSAMSTSHGEARSDTLLGPVFAVIGQPDGDTTRWIASQRRPSEVGVAFVVAEEQGATLDELTRAGWTCVPVRNTDDPADAWASVAQFAGVDAEVGRR